MYMFGYKRNLTTDVNTAILILTLMHPLCAWIVGCQHKVRGRSEQTTTTMVEYFEEKLLEYIKNTINLSSIAIMFTVLM